MHRQPHHHLVQLLMQSLGDAPDQFHFRLLDSLVHVVSEPRSRCSHHSWGVPYLWGYPKRALDGFFGGKSICKWMIKVGYPYFRKPSMLTHALDCFGSMPPNMERLQPGLNLGIPMQTWNGAGWNKVDTTRAARKLLAANVQNIQNVQPMVGVIIIPFIRLKIQNLWNHWKKIPDVTTSPVDHLCWLHPTPSSVEASFVVDLVLPIATRHALGTSLPSARHLRPVSTVSEDLSAIALLVSN